MDLGEIETEKTGPSLLSDLVPYRGLSWRKGRLAAITKLCAADYKSFKRSGKKRAQYPWVGIRKHTLER